MPYDTLLYDVAGGVARITLNRPPANPVNLELARELMDVSIRCDEDPAVRAVLLSSKGRFFCVGGDLAAFREVKEDLPSYVKKVTTHLHAAISRFARMRAPMIAAVHGAAAGAGASLAFAADLAVAAESASFTLAYTAAGLAPDGSSTWFLPRLVGPRRALELLLTNRTLSAREALDWGLVNEVVPDARVAARAEELATTLASGATQALGAAKRLLLASASESLETQMELESRAIADAAHTADAREGVSSFLEKRKPSFKGE